MRPNPMLHFAPPFGLINIRRSSFSGSTQGSPTSRTPSRQAMQQNSKLAGLMAEPRHMGSTLGATWTTSPSSSLLDNLHWRRLFAIALCTIAPRSDLRDHPTWHHCQLPDRPPTHPTYLHGLDITNLIKWWLPGTVRGIVPLVSWSICVAPTGSHSINLGATFRNAPRTDGQTITDALHASARPTQRRWARVRSFVHSNPVMPTVSLYPTRNPHLGMFTLTVWIPGVLVPRPQTTLWQLSDAGG